MTVTRDSESRVSLHSHLQIRIIRIQIDSITPRISLPSTHPWWKRNVLHIDIRSRGALPCRESSITVLSHFKLSVHKLKGPCTSARETGVLVWMHEVQDPKNQLWWHDFERAERVCRHACCLASKRDDIYVLIWSITERDQVAWAWPPRWEGL
jgi:hypothetical protein